METKLSPRRHNYGEKESQKAVDGFATTGNRDHVVCYVSFHIFLLCGLGLGLFLFVLLLYVK